jgi:Papain family cysteine protease/Cathepsin propeptide inhibitor domain (I29)
MSAVALVAALLAAASVSVQAMRPGFSDTHGAPVLELREAASSLSTLRTRFAEWAATHGKLYSSPAEAERRFAIWAAHAVAVDAANAGPRQLQQGMRRGLNAHSDLTSQEFVARFLGPPMAAPQQNSATANKPHPQEHWRYENVTAPPTVDWRQHKPPVLGHIKDQHVNGTPCGSCWAFSATGIIETASALATGALVWCGGLLCGGTLRDRLGMHSSRTSRLQCAAAGAAA